MTPDEEFAQIERDIIHSTIDEFMVSHRNKILEEVAREIEKFKGFGEDTIASFTVYIRSMKK